MRIGIDSFFDSQKRLKIKNFTHLIFSYKVLDKIIFNGEKYDYTFTLFSHGNIF